MESSAQDLSNDRASEYEVVIAQFIDSELIGKDDAPVGPEDNLFVTGSVDSVGIMRLIAHLEETLGVKIPPSDLVPKNFRTIRVMAAYLDRLSSD